MDAEEGGYNVTAFTVTICMISFGASEIDDVRPALLLFPKSVADVCPVVELRMNHRTFWSFAAASV